MAWIRLGGGRGATGRWRVQAAVHGRKNRGLAEVRQSNDSGHRLAREKVREQEENEANPSMQSMAAIGEQWLLAMSNGVTEATA